VPVINRFQQRKFIWLELDPDLKVHLLYHSNTGSLIAHLVIQAHLRPSGIGERDKE
jgi:hypothetical protein